MSTNPNIPIDAVNLLPAIDKKLMELLMALTPAQWHAQTVAKQWKIKDVVAHLLDGNIRVLSMLRDNYQGEKAELASHQDLVDFLNRLNQDWVNAMKRVSPDMLILLHQITGPLYCRYYQGLNPFDKAGFAVNWAGEQESKNWMHIAREYTEKFLHQQQIRQAINSQEIMTCEFFYPFIDIFMLAMPHTYRDVDADDGTVIQLTVTTDIGGSWFLVRVDGKWQLQKNNFSTPATQVIIHPDTSWKLFSKSLRPEDVKNKVEINGNQKLGDTALAMVSVMA